MDKLFLSPDIIKYIITAIVSVVLIFYVIRRIIDNRNLTKKQRNLYIILTLISLPIGALLYFYKSNQLLCEKYNSN